MLIPAYWTVVWSTAGGGLTSADRPPSLAYIPSGLLTPSSEMRGVLLTELSSFLSSLHLLCSSFPVSTSDVFLKEPQDPLGTTERGE